MGPEDIITQVKMCLYQTGHDAFAFQRWNGVRMDFNIQCHRLIILHSDLSK